MGDGADMAREWEAGAWAEEDVHIVVKGRRKSKDFDETHSHIDRSVWWITADGEVIEIVKMGDRHLINSIHFMLRQVGQFGDKVEFIQRVFNEVGNAGAQGYLMSEQWPPADVKYSSRARWEAARKRWKSFDPMVNEAIRRNILTNTLRA